MTYIKQTIPTGLQPDGDYVPERADGSFFVTTTPLAADATYTSPWFDVDGFGTLELYISSDVPSATKGVVIEFTEDTSIETPLVTAIVYYDFKPADIKRGFKDLHLRPKLDGFRLRYVNGPAPQSSVYLSSTGRVRPEIGVENSGNAVVFSKFGREVALGNVSNYGQNTKFGRNPEIDTLSPADIWGGGRNVLGLLDYKGFDATANENMATVSTSASDRGTLVSSGTVTTTGATQLIDSTATFVTDTVAVGDIVLNDTRGIFGYIASVDSETQVTLHRMQDGSIGSFINIVGDTYRIATPASTGAAVVAWKRILNANYEAQTTLFVILNGLTTVTSTVDAYRCSRGKVLLAGSSGSNAGEIQANQATTTANVFCVMPAGGNQTLIAADTVPKNTVYLLESVATAMSVSGGSAASAVVSLRVRPRGGVFNTERVYDLSSTGGAYVDLEEGGITLDEGTDFKLRADSVSANNTRISGKIEYLEINEI